MKRLIDKEREAGNTIEDACEEAPPLPPDVADVDVAPPPAPLPCPCPPSPPDPIPPPPPPLAVSAAADSIRLFKLATS